MQKILLAYLAGAIDSDGTIGIKRSTYAMRVRKDAGQPVYSERVALRQVTPDIPNLLRSAFGGSLYITKSSVARGRSLHSWAATDLRAAECLLALRPYLRVKRIQATNALRLRPLKARSLKYRVRKGRGHVGGAVRPAEISEAMEAVYIEAKRLNVTGI